MKEHLLASFIENCIKCIISGTASGKSCQIRIERGSSAASGIVEAMDRHM